MPNNLLNNVEFVVAEAPASAAQTEIVTDVIDMSGFHGVTFVAYLGDVTSGSVLGFVVDHSEDGVTGWDDLEGPLAHTADADDADGKMLVLDVVRPERRYLRARLTRNTQSAAINGIFAVKYGPSQAPVTQGASVLASATLPNGWPSGVQFG
ncbi:MAG TPA: hypothetical protein VGN79_14340 [Devosia sp.]|jgi:hypothetical protein|nr:hypothetical protein [Devosia sp.]